MIQLAIFDQEDIMDFNGFTFLVTFNDDSLAFNLTMTVNALQENNNTRITCLVYASDYYSNVPGTLTVIGILSKLMNCLLCTDQSVNCFFSGVSYNM